VSYIYCPECGFQNQEAANYCSKCGAALVHDPAEGDTTMTFTPDEGEEGEGPPIAEELTAEGPALVVRSGGGRAGEHFSPQGERTTIGRSPDCDIFLDDVTVSRKHAVLVQGDGRFTIEDQGSLNGTYVNRRRIDSSPLSDGDELQIGKYRLTFLLGS
jgi:rubredoxin